MSSTITGMTEDVALYFHITIFFSLNVFSSFILCQRCFICVTANKQQTSFMWQKYENKVN